MLQLLPLAGQHRPAYFGVARLGFRSCCLLLALAPLPALWADESVSFVQAQQYQCGDTPLAQARADTKAYILDINACVQEGEYQSALKLALAAKTAALTAGDDNGFLQSLNAEAAVLFYLSAYADALERYEQIRQTWQPHQDSQLLLNSENNAAALLNRLQRPGEARALAESALARATALNNEIYIASVSGTLASSMAKLRHYDRAEVLLKTCRDVGERHQSRLLIVGCAQVEAEMYAAQSMWPAALMAAERGLAVSQDQSLRSELPELQLSKATALRGLKQFEAALASAQTGLNMALEMQKLDAARELWQLIAQLQTGAQNLPEALRAQSEVVKLSQQIFDRQLANITAVQRVQHEVEAKESEITLLKKENEIQQAKVGIANAERTSAILISLLAIAVFGVGFSRWIHKRDLARARASHDELERLHELKDQFLANTSHELRTPLNGIIGLADVLKEDEQVQRSAEAGEQLAMIRDCGTQLSQLVDNILDFSKLRADKMRLAHEALPVAQALNEAVQLLRPLARAHHLELRVELNEELPALWADPARLRQVLQNLIGNAIKFTKAGSIVVSAQRDGDQIIIHVRDTGIGIAPEHHGIIFEPFEQVDGSTQRRYGGTGLGLAIARALVRAHGGELRVASALGQGADFWFNIPVAKV